MKKDHTKLLRLEEVVVALGVSFQGVRNHIAVGDLVAVRVGERGVRVREEDVARFIERGAASREPLAGRQEPSTEVIK